MTPWPPVTDSPAEEPLAPSEDGDPDQPEELALPEDPVAAPATRSARLAAALLDLGFLLVTPLIPTLVLFALRRPDNTIPPPDQYLREMEGTGQPVASRLLGHGWACPVALAVPAVLLLGYQLFLLIRHRQTLGQRIVGLAWERNDGSPQVVGVAVARVLLFGLLALVLGRWLPPTPFKLPLLARASFA